MDDGCALPGLADLGTSVPSPRLDARVPQRVVERFFARVVKTPECWIWTGAVSSPDGYGRVSFHVDGRPRTVAAHRLALMIEQGSMKGEFVAEHFCNEPLCVRVDGQHVHASTQSENLRHAVQCGRAIGPRVAVDSSLRLQRSLDVRALARSGFSESEYRRIVEKYSRSGVPDDQLPLF